MENTTLCDISALVTALAASVVLVIKGMHSTRCRRVRVCCGLCACERKIKRSASDSSLDSISETK